LTRAAAADEPPLLWFGAFAQVEEVDAATWLPDPAGAWCGPAEPRIRRTAHGAALERLHRHILDGDIYQANFTFRAEAPTAGHPLALYAALRARAGGGHSALVFTGEHWILSFSPELFFALRGGLLTTRPMKGTAARGATAAADAAAAAQLAVDAKQRAENLMIVDLLRNDLSRVARVGSVDVPALFTVETYPTLHQLTSTVTARLEAGRDAVDVIEALFPCGSVTGAPKVRAMEIIAAQEEGPRGVYCGSIGRIQANGDASFNVAIRTLLLRPGEPAARLGLGSGIVADSRADEEWRECIAKGAFLATQRPFDLIETMRHDARDGLIHLEWHMERLRRSAAALGFAFDRHQARNELQAAVFGAGDARVRLALSRSGALAVTVGPMPEPPEEPVAVALAPLPVASHDFRLRHKTTDRDFYRKARRSAGSVEVAFFDAEGFLTEGSFTNLFVEREGVLLTPPLSRGLLPGVQRGCLIEEGRAREADLRAEDLEGGFLIGNSLRGLMRAVLV
jgi:para-aminobenzoate synthetase/4-amino-4-deoxychorismate lyase